MRRIAALLMAALACAIFSGCDRQKESLPSEILGSDVYSEQEFSAFPVQVCGVTLQKAVERAVSLSPTLTEVICELGFSDTLVGISDYCDDPKTSVAISDNGYSDNSSSIARLGSPENPNLEEIVRLKPDTVFTISPLSERETYLLEQAKIAVVNIPNPTTVEGYAAMYSEIAAAYYGMETVGEKGGRKSEEIGDNARKSLERAAEGIELGTFVYVTEKLTIAGTDTIESAVLSLAGSNANTAAGYIQGGDYTGGAPDYIIASDALTMPQLQSSAAVKAMIDGGAKVCFVDSQCFERPSARIMGVFDEIRAQIAG